MRLHTVIIKYEMSALLCISINTEYIIVTNMHSHYMFGITLHNDNKRKHDHQAPKKIKTLDI